MKERKVVFLGRFQVMRKAKVNGQNEGRADCYCERFTEHTD